MCGFAVGSQKFSAGVSGLVKKSLTVPGDEISIFFYISDRTLQVRYYSFMCIPYIDWRAGKSRYLRHNQSQ